MIRALREQELPEADRIFRLAFATFIGIKPEEFSPGRDYLSTRFHTDPSAALAVDVDGTLAGTNVLSNFAAFASFGPLTTLPEHWNKGLAQQLLARTVEMFSEWGAQDAGLFTFVQSQKHIALYQKFGFWPRSVIGLMGKQVIAAKPAPRIHSDCAAALCRDLMQAIMPGYDPTRQIEAVARLQLGETVLVGDNDLESFAICHCGENTEAGPGNCYIKFAAVRPGPDLDARTARLMDAVESMALARGLDHVEAGVHLDVTPLYRHLLSRGYALQRTALAMYQSAKPAFIRPGVHILADWR